MQKITIIGAGPVGTLLSLYLSTQGYKVEIFERRRDPRLQGAEKGRSINLALSHRGWKSLEGIDKFLVQEVKEMAIPMKGRMVHIDGHQSFQPYGNENQNIYSVSRSGLNEILINYAQNHFSIPIHFNERNIDLNLSQDEVIFENTITSVKSKKSSDIIFGADGSFSSLRSSLQKTDRFNYSQEYLEHGYKELTIPAKEGKHQLEKNALHIWPRHSFMLIALPNPDGSFTCTLFLPLEGKESFQSLYNEKEVEIFFLKNFPDAFVLMPDIIEEFFNNPTSSLVTIKSNPWIYKNRYVLIGDAAHAIVPFYGQGMNAGFEDCYVLNNIINNYKGDWTKIFSTYQNLRKPDADAISELALKNFIEMRDLVADERFLLRKKIETKLNLLYPNDWIPLYSMVTFSDMRYSEALNLGKIQEEIMEEVLDISGIEISWENLDYEGVINKYRNSKKMRRSSIL